MIKFGETSRGFAIGKFTDRNKQSCSIQESSLAGENCIWLGVTDSDRMHLTEAHVTDLVTTMDFWLKFGRLPENRAELDGFQR